MMNEEKKKRIKIVALIFVVLVVAILAILIGSKQVANPITKDANQRAQFFVDLGNLLPKKKDTIKNGTAEDATNNTSASSTTGSTIPLKGSLIPTKDTNGDGVINNKDAVIDTNKDGVIDSKDTSTELLQDVLDTNSDNGPSAIPSNNEDALKELIKRDTIATKDLVVTASTDTAKTKDQLTISWSSPTKMDFASCVGSYAGGVYQQKDLKSKGVNATAYVQSKLYNWNGKQPVPTKPQTKKTQMPYGDKEIIYVLTCEKPVQAQLSSTAKTETASTIGFGTAESQVETADTTPPKEYVVAQVALILDDGTSGNTTKDCSIYPANVSVLMPECNPNADASKELSLIASPEVVQPDGTSTLFWFSPAGTAFASCEGVGAGATVSTGGVDTSSWIGSKPVPDNTTPVQNFGVTPKNKDSRYAISCVTKAGKTLRANTSIQIQTTNTGTDLCDNLPLNLQKIYCPDLDKDNFFDTDTYVPDTTGNTCSNGTSGQNTPIILTTDEQAEYDKLLRQFFRLLPQIRTPEAIAGIGHDIEELQNSKNYVKELTSICQEQTQDIANGDLVPDPSKSPKRRIAPFYVDSSIIFDTDQASASGDTQDCRWDNHKQGQELILSWTHLSESLYDDDDDVGGYKINVPRYNKDGSVSYTNYNNPRADANTNVFYSFGKEDKEQKGGVPWAGIQDAVQRSFAAFDYGQGVVGDGIGFNCKSDISWSDGYNLGLAYDTGKTYYDSVKQSQQPLYDTKNKCGFSSTFEKIFGIGQ
ncbi:MAG: hypothetical protein WCO58_02555 [bacterium]